jgi:hypothetical protein
MKQENYTKALVITFAFISLVVCFSGCTSNQNTNGNGNIFSGTWVGNVDMSLSGGRGNTSVTQIIFTGSNAEMTLNSDQGSFITNYTFTTNGNTMILEPKFNDRGGFPGRQPNNSTVPGNWTRPPSNETWPTNGTRPYNGTRPGNWTRPENGTWNPGGGRPSMSISFTYSVNEDYTVLYLNGAEFRKI